MKQFRYAVSEINNTLNSIILFDVFLSTVILFLIIYLVLLVIGYSGLYSIIPSLIYLAVMMAIKSRENKVRTVEKKYPMLDERLRTAADNVHLENEVIDELDRELIGEIKDVETSSFLDTRKSSMKIITSITLCFIILLLASFEIQPIKFDPVVHRIIRGLDISGKSNESSNLAMGGPVGAGDVSLEGEIFGQSAPVKFSRREEKIQIGTTGYEVNVRNIRDARPQEFQEQFPEEIFVESAAAYEENIPKEQQELVRNYFKKLAEAEK